MKKAFITGINGQDGSYLAEFLLEKGYEVHGILKRNSVAENQTARLDDVFDKLHLYYGDMNDLSSLISVLQKVQPDEIYNLAAQSHVRISFDEPIFTSNVTGMGVLNLLEGCQDLGAGGILCATTEVIKRGREKTGKNLGCDIFLDTIKFSK